MEMCKFYLFETKKAPFYIDIFILCYIIRISRRLGKGEVTTPIPLISLNGVTAFLESSTCKGDMIDVP